MPSRQNIHLHDGWKFRRCPDRAQSFAQMMSPRGTPWKDATVPGCVHLDLLAHGDIADPFYRNQELDVRWIEDADWLYMTTFDRPSAHLEQKITLESQGLDTISSLWLNGQMIGETNNMFLPYRFDVTERLLEKNNQLLIRFSSAIAHANQLERDRSPLSGWFDTARLQIRKAQFSTGWDFAPRLVSCGVWRPIGLEVWGPTKIADVWVRTRTVTPRRATVDVVVEVESLSIQNIDLVLSACLGDKVVWSAKASQRVRAGRQQTTFRASIDHPKLWWPNGIGESPLYDFRVELIHSGATIEIFQTRTGIRTVALERQNEPEGGESFIFRVNGVPIFCKGANWVPMDALIPRPKAKDYERMIQTARQANMNMLRVWGGGVYEDEAFYDACDRNGILVWQDFMFSGGYYPEHLDFLRQVESEARYVLLRLRNRPSVIIWCGNNENNWAHATGEWGPSPRFWGETIYHRLLPELTEMLDPDRPYWPSSPFGAKHPNAPEQGDRHCWEVWTRWANINQYIHENGRFISEFGIQAMPDWQTVKDFTKPEDRSFQNRVLEHHQKAPDGQARLMRYMVDMVPLPVDLEQASYLSQIVQAEALKTAVEHWRRHKQYTSGTLIWQFNDCWPAISWSIMDYFGRAKAAYFAARRFFHPILVSMRFVSGVLEIWVTNDMISPARGVLTLYKVRNKGQIQRLWSQKIQILANSGRRVAELRERTIGTLDPERECLLTEWVGENNVVLENALYLAPPKHFELLTESVKAKVKAAPNNMAEVELRSQTLYRMVALSLPGIAGLDALWSDNWFDLFPGRPHKVLIPLPPNVKPAVIKTKLKALSLNTSPKPIKLVW